MEKQGHYYTLMEWLKMWKNCSLLYCQGCIITTVTSENIFTLSTKLDIQNLQNTVIPMNNPN